MAQSPSFIPLRCHLITCMQQIAAYAQVFIPTASKVLEILDSADLHSKPSPSTDTAPKLNFMIKFPAESLHKPSVKDAVVQKVVTLLRQDTETYRYHVGLPEYLFITLRKLRKFNKKCRNSRWKDLLRAVINQFDLYSNSVISQRSQLRKAVVEIVDFEPLLPVGSPAAAIRLTNLMASNNQADSADEIIIPSSTVKVTKNMVVGDKHDDAEDLRREGGSKKKSYDDDDEDEDDNETDKVSASKDKKIKTKTRTTKSEKKGKFSKKGSMGVDGDLSLSVNVEDKLTEFDWSDDES